MLEDLAVKLLTEEIEATAVVELRFPYACASCSYRGKAGVIASRSGTTLAVGFKYDAPAHEEAQAKAAANARGRAEYVAATSPCPRCGALQREGRRARRVEVIAASVPLLVAGGVAGLMLAAGWIAAGVVVVVVGGAACLLRWRSYREEAAMGQAGVTFEADDATVAPYR